MRFCFLLLLCSVVRGGDLDVSELVQASLDLYEKNWRETRDYGFVERARKIDLDKEGNEKKTDIKAFQVLMIEGSHYRRLISRFDEPLSPEEEASERLKLEEEIALRRKENEKKRAERIRRFDKRRNQTLDALLEIPDAFLFRLLGEDKVRGRPAYVIAVEPRPGYRPRSLKAKVYTELEGKIWIDRENTACVKVRVEMRDRVNLAWFLVRIHEGAEAEVENMQISDGLWATKRLWYRASARIGLVKLMHIDQEYLYRDYEKLDPEEYKPAQSLPAGEVGHR